MADGSYAHCYDAEITATNGGSGTMYFQGTTANGTSTTKGGSPQDVTNSGTYYFRARSAAGCWGPAGSIKITIYPLPTNLTTSGAGTFCGSTSISATGGGSGTTIYFQGTNANGFDQTSGGSPQTVTTTGTYYFRARSASGCWGAPASVTVTIKPVPTGNFTASKTTICAGQSVTFTAPTGSNYAYTFYDNSTKVQGSDNNNTYSSSALANGDQVTVDIANSFNCGTTLGPITMVVNSLPAPTISADKTSICPGENVTFTAGGGSTGATYIFTKNGNPIQSGTSNTYATTTLQNNDVVSVKITDANSCTAASATPVVMTVNPVPAGTLTPASATICAGDNVTFTATPGFDTYEFKVNGSTVQGAGGSNTFSSTTLTNPSVVTVLVATAAGCSATFNSASVTVNPIPAGSVSFTESSGTPDDGSICSWLKCEIHRYAWFQ